MFTRIEDFKKTYGQEVKFTEAVLGALTDESLSQAVTEGHRTLGRMAWHTVTTLPEMMGQVGLEFSGVAKDDPVPATAAEIKSAYSAAAKAVLDQGTTKWTDETLAQEDNMYGETWKRGQTLLVLAMHEVHHRGQMTVLMRQAGVKVPDIYGPAKEGWTAYGAEPPKI